MKKLSPVVSVNDEKCVKCNVCVRHCPTRFCNDGSHEGRICINTDQCIGCGACIAACIHDARMIIDDTDKFFADLARGTKMIAVVAPAIAASFPNQYLHFNSWLKSLGIEAVFDVSFGAELTVKSYLEHVKTNEPELVIAQPCPAIVTYIQIYRPELIPYLAPAHSPMLHTIKMIKEFFADYRHHRVAVISPCVAKKREYEETGLGDYNVTMAKLDDYIKEHKINLTRFEPSDYDGPLAERAVLFSSPGGLMETAMREVPGIEKNIRKIEGHGVYHYLDKLYDSVKAGINPLLIDCLNCEHGCNGGPGTKLSHASQDVMEHLIKTRSNELQESYKKEEAQHPGLLAERIEAHWKPDIYERRYRNLRENNTIRIPSKEQVQRIFSEQLAKKTEADVLNCGACGYKCCEQMATALFNKVSCPDLCYPKHQNELLMHQEEAEQKSAERERFANDLFSAVQGMVGDVNKTAALMQNVNTETEQMSGMIAVIAKIARQTNLLALNASIEAARAGAHGRGFAVVAEEVRNLAKSSNDAAEQIATLVTGASAQISDGAAMSKKVEQTLVGIMENAKQRQD